VPSGVAAVQCCGLAADYEIGGAVVGKITVVIVNCVDRIVGAVISVGVEARVVDLDVGGLPGGHGDEVVLTTIVVERVAVRAVESVDRVVVGGAGDALAGGTVGSASVTRVIGGGVKGSPCERATPQASERRT